MRPYRLGLAALLAAMLAACATPDPAIPTAPPSRNPPKAREAIPARPVPVPEPPAAREPPTRESATRESQRRETAPPPPSALPPSAGGLGLAVLPGWADEDHVAALRAYQAGCGADASARTTCAQARSLTLPDDETARVFLETFFRLEPVGQDLGLLTAYFAPEYQARFAPDGEFTAPVRPRPADLDPNRSYPDRTTIEARPARDALAWMRPEDLFFLQIQGSGSLTFPDGQRLRANFAGHNGRAFVGIAAPMRQRGLLADADTSGEAIRAWLASHGGPQADAIMRLNPRYVFFSLGPDDGNDPLGAAGVPLPAGRSIAVDPSFHAYGAAYWIDATAPVLNGAFPAYRRLVMALDTGGAIRGQVRADLYMGRGPQAGAEAGRVRHSLRMFKLVPVGP